MIQMFLNFSYFSTNLDFVYLCFPLFTFVYLCSTDASMHKFCACYYYNLNTTKMWILINEIKLRNQPHSQCFLVHVLTESPVFLDNVHI